jgi:hypothetical protein
MTSVVEIIFAIGLLIGFALEYGVRAFVSYRRHQAAKRRTRILMKMAGPRDLQKGEVGIAFPPSCKTLLIPPHGAASVC